MSRVKSTSPNPIRVRIELENAEAIPGENTPVSSPPTRTVNRKKKVMMIPVSISITNWKLLTAALAALIASTVMINEF
jgi:hypothetical protein